MKETNLLYFWAVKVKEEVERCLAAGMSKEQMFHELREKGFHPAAAFAGKLYVSTSCVIGFITSIYLSANHVKKLLGYRID